MKKLHPLLCQSITQLNVDFVDDLGNKISILATGFWLRDESNKVVLVTNRHNFDLKLKKPANTGYKIEKIKVRLREKKEDVYTSKTSFFELNLKEIEGKVHKGADTAIIIFPKFPAGIIVSELGQFSLETIAFAELADESFFTSWCEIFDPIGFIGYPQDWYDTASNAPIGRLAYISSDPCVSYSNKAIKTSAVTLVSGLSFGGSSGSPVFFLPKGLNLTGGNGIEINSHYTSWKLIGIMSGHYWDLPQSGEPVAKNDPQLPSHSGLSYFTRSSAIHELFLESNTINLSEYLFS